MELDVEMFLSPVSDEEPCGPDLNKTFDPDFIGYLARVGGSLPASYFTFKRDSGELVRQMEAAVALSGRTRDVRLVVLFAKLAILNRDLGGFVSALEILARVLAERWEDVHPQADDGDYALRAATVRTLDDMPHVIMPIQHLSLLESRGIGPISYRMARIAEGAITARQGETAVDPGAIKRAFENCDVKALEQRRAQFRAVLAAVEAIERIFLEREATFALERLRAIVSEICAFFDRHLEVPAQEGGHATGAAGGDAPQEAGASCAPAGAPGVRSLPSRAAAAAALLASERYFLEAEPSSPALVLVRFARQLMGKPFFEVLQLMIPDYATRAEIGFGRNALRLPVEHLAAGWVADAETEAAALGDEEALPAADCRRDAQRLLDEAAKYLRTTEPSSPIPLLLERARELAGQDFSALLKDMFTDAALRGMKGEEA